MINLGDKAKDMISGLEGIVVSKIQYINGCRQAELQPECNDKRQYLEGRYVDERQLEVLEENSFPAIDSEEDEKQPAGGKRNYPNRRK